jgi:phosphotriesterase-related protein
VVDVQTVLGPVDSGLLGRTLMHEHVRISWHGWKEDSTVTFDRPAALSRAIDQLAELKSLGISTFVDPAPIDLGRDVEFLAEVSQGSGVNIVCATGLYAEHNGFPPYFQMRTVEELTEIYLHELTKGVGQTGIRPGIIKCATGAEHVGEHEEKALRAAARAQQATGVPIITHTSAGRFGPEQLDIFESEGVRPSSCLIGHCGFNSDISYHLSLLRRGCAVGFDQIDLPFLQDDEVHLALVSSLIRLGWEQQIVLSHDNVSCYPGRFINLPQEVVDMVEKRTFTNVITTFIPALVERFGIRADIAETLLLDNPRRIFETAYANAKN